MSELDLFRLLKRKEVMNSQTGTIGTEGKPHNFLTHAHVYNKVDSTFNLENRTELLLRIMSYGTTVTLKDVLLIETLTTMCPS